MTVPDPAPAGGRLDAAQRRLLLGVCLVVGAATVVPATYNYVLNPMLDGLGASETRSAILRQLPSIAALLVIFLAGVLGSRLGERRVITAGSAMFVVGCGVVTVAPALPVAVVGLVLESVGASALLVVALALVSAQVSDADGRASAFAAFAVVGPCVYTLAPVLAGVLVDEAGWRWVPALWTAAGLVMVVASRHLLPHREGGPSSGELLTPALAGLVLALAVQSINAIRADGWGSVSFLVRAAGAVLAATALAVAHRRSAAPSLSLAPLRRGGTPLLLVVVVIIPFGSLWYYLTLGFQYVYGLDTLQTALVMIVPQVCGVAGGMLARTALRRRGITATGVGAILVLAASLAAAWAIRVDGPLLVPVLVLSAYATASVAAGIPVTNAIMDSAPPEEAGGASAYRGAAANLGSALGVVVMTAIVFGTFAGSLAAGLRSEGLPGHRSEDIAARIRNGTSSESLASDYSVPVEQVDEISVLQRAAMVDALHAQGTAGAAVTAACAGLFILGRRRQARAPTPVVAGGTG